MNNSQSPAIICRSQPAPYETFAPAPVALRACACVSVPAHVFGASRSSATAARLAPPQASLASGLPAASKRCAALVSDPLRRGPVERGRGWRTRPLPPNEINQLVEAGLDHRWIVSRAALE
jgi:hypothetical protein